MAFPKEIQPPKSVDNAQKKTLKRYAVHEDRPTIPAGHSLYHALAHPHHPSSESEEQHQDHGHAQYAYKYAVHDHHTGDAKKAWEQRDGDVTHGGYSVVDPDGYLRIVEYTVTKDSGFQATVRREPLYDHQQPQ